MPNHKIERPDFPSDWLDDRSAFHGFSKVGRTRRYRPVLYLNGAQHYFGECKSREDAARAYDRLLRFFLPFTCSRALPNFRDEFLALGKDEALSYGGDGCLTSAKLISLEEELTEQFESFGRDVEAAKNLRFKEIQDWQPTKTNHLLSARIRAIARLERQLSDFRRVDFDASYSALGLPSTSLLTSDANKFLSGAKSSLKDLQSQLSDFIDTAKLSLNL